MPRPSQGRQRIPRPEGAREGGPPPWTGRVTGPVPVAQVRRAMEKAGPAVAYPPRRPGFPEDEHQLPVGSAVLIPIFEEDGEARVILTRRAAHLRSHTGEVAFPGGRLDPGESPVAAALREAAEEVGIEESAVEILGQLAPLATVSSRAGITPFVGVLAERPVLTPNPDEVEHAFDVAFSELFDAEAFMEEWWRWPGADEERPIYFFHLPDDIVWGATARMLYELLELVSFA